MDLLYNPSKLLLATARDVLPVLLLLVVFQKLVLRRPLPRPARIFTGFAFVLLGMTLFLAGLELALFPVGRTMALQLVQAANSGGGSNWTSYFLVYLFAALLGFSTTIAEPALIAVAHKAQEASRGAISSWNLRVAVAVGVALGIAVGTFRIVTGTPLHWYILASYVVVAVQTIFAPRVMIPLAYDTGGVTTSTVTVPLVAALGLGLASNIPGRSPIIDGFGLIAFASVFPIISVLAYAQMAQWAANRRSRKQRRKPTAAKQNQDNDQNKGEP
ncbi:MAG: DUF1538 domain-containing protein [Proteobacteria bacterium]|nr:DUF1538 domain-containing protein [Pseudomonadota bacterium]